jgi:hypothetical protein
MATVSVVVPFRPDGAERDRNWEYVRTRYETLYPDWEVVEGRCDTKAWAKGRAVNAAVEASSGDALVIADADVMVGEGVLREAVRRLEDSAWVVPHRLVYRLTKEATEAVLDGRLRTPGKLSQDEAFTRKGPQGGGISVIHRKDFIGMDERFVDWGGEDISFAWALDTLVGPHRRLGEVMWHLYHEPMHGDDRRGSSETEALAGRYREAYGNPVKMSDLVTERADDGVPGGGIVVMHKETAREVPIDARFEGWGQEDETFGVCLRAIKGQEWRGVADLVHLHHPPAIRISRCRGSWENQALRKRYLKANPEQMRTLLEEARESLESN